LHALCDIVHEWIATFWFISRSLSVSLAAEALRPLRLSLA
jgi:hypothetical protein